MELVVLGSVFVVLLFLGFYVSIALLTAGIATVFFAGLPPLIVAERLVSSLNSLPLVAVPLFILAALIMNKGGLTAHLVGASRAFVGHVRGGSAQVNVVASMVFAGMSGAATADAAGIGSMLIPEMKKEGYPGGFAIGITAASSTIGPIIPPSITMVIYASITELSVGRLFLAGVVPGFAIGVALMIMAYIISVRQNYPKLERVPWLDRFRVAARAAPALGAPAIIFGGIVFGLYTPTEAGVAACVYGVFVGAVIYRGLSLKTLLEALVETVEYTAVPLFIVASAALFGWLLTIFGMGEVLVSLIGGLDVGRLGVLFIVFAVVMVLGLFIDGLTIIIIFVPIFSPLIPAFGLDPLHFGLVVIVTMLIGAVTPPVGLLLFIAATVGDVPVKEAVIWPFVFVMCIVVVLMILFPAMVTALPNFVLSGYR